MPKASPKVLRRVPKAQPHLGTRIIAAVEPKGMVESSSGESLAAHLASVSRKPNGMWSRPLGNAAETEEPNELSDQEGSVWDDDFAEAPDLKRFEKSESSLDLTSSRTEHLFNFPACIIARAEKSSRDEPDNMKTIKPTKSPLGSPPEVTRTISSIGRFGTESPSLYKDDSSEDYSDLAPADESDLNEKLQRFKLNGLQMGKIYRPEDISMLSLRGTPGPSRPTSSRDISSSLSQRPRLGSGGSFGSGSSRSPSRTSSFRFTPTDDAEQIKATERELSKYAEVEEEDYDDVFGIGEALKGNIGKLGDCFLIRRLLSILTRLRRSSLDWLRGVQAWYSAI